MEFSKNKFYQVNINHKKMFAIPFVNENSLLLMTETGNIISEDNKCYLFTVQNTGLVQYLPFIVNDLSVSELDNIPEDVKQFLLEMVHRVSDNFSLAVKYAEILQQLRDSGFSVKENFEEHMTKYKLER